FRSVHSNVEEKNKSLYPLLQAGVETTVDRTQKNSRILKWIQSSNKKTPEENPPRPTIHLDNEGSIQR
ncbi:Serine/threonineprotein kinase_ putativelike, partial [Caligus rogercresseyi]